MGGWWVAWAGRLVVVASDNVNELHECARHEREADAELTGLQSKFGTDMQRENAWKGSCQTRVGDGEQFGTDVLDGVRVQGRCVGDVVKGAQDKEGAVGGETGAGRASVADGAAETVAVQNVLGRRGDGLNHVVSLLESLPALRRNRADPHFL